MLPIIKRLFATGCCAAALLLPGAGHGQGKSTLQLLYDTSAITELYDALPVGITVENTRGRKAQTAGWLGGSLRWKAFDIRVFPGTFEAGTVRFDRQAVRRNGDHIDLTVIPRAQPSDSQHFRLEIPFLSKIRFNFFEDSIKRAIPFYLNVEGIYSSGRTFPLDTSDIRFRTDNARLLQGNTLLVPADDHQTETVVLDAVYKGDTALRLHTVLPVKTIWDPYRKMPAEPPPARKRRR
ncbi:hypothetical protein [Compostibacter hankyongensis]|uniref:Uncharacterized protein n=1 Tax=Compostibacter hankyongensis TaxID=1007089 RepID=A0ABP8FXF9_9BACT